LGDGVAAYVAEVSRRRRETLGPEILALSALFIAHGAPALQGASEQAQVRGAYGAEYVRLLVEERTRGGSMLPRLTLVVPGVPSQSEVDRLLSSYEQFVVGAVAMDGVGS
jgi:hypothetical protein